MVRALCVVMLLCVGAVVLAADPSPDEQKRLEAVKKQEEFRKAYNSVDPNEQLKALDLLDVTANPASWDCLISIVKGTTSKTVRLAAFKKLCAVPAKRAKLSETLAALFEDAVKPSEVETKIEYAQEMGKSEFKYAIYDALAEYGSKLRYPDLVSGYMAGRNVGGGDPNIMLRRQRAEFEKYADAFDAITGAKVTAHDKSSPRQFATWWTENKAKLLQDDRQLAAKYEAEAVAERAKMPNPLLPKSAIKTQE